MEFDIKNITPGTLLRVKPGNDPILIKANGTIFTSSQADVVYVVGFCFKHSSGYEQILILSPAVGLAKMTLWIAPESYYSRFEVLCR